MTTDRDTDFTSFVIANRTRLERAARLLTSGHAPDAEDLVQQTLTKLYVRWPRIASGPGPLTYAYRALTTTFIDERRRAWRRHERSSAIQSDAVVNAVDSDTPTMVLAALGTLPPRQRAVIVLRYWLDQSVEQTAQSLGCSEGTVKSQCSKALTSLRSRLTDIHTDSAPRGERS